MEFVANFVLNNESLDAEFDVSELQNFDAIFEINASGTTWGSIDGNIENQTDLKTSLDTLSGQIDSNHSEITTIANTLQTYGDIVTHYVTEFASATQGELAESALQPGDNITELNNNAGYITGIDYNAVTTALGYTPYNSTNPDGYITGINSGDVTTALGYTPVNPSSLASVATSGSYADLSNKPTIGDGVTTFYRNNTSVGSISANQTESASIIISVPTTATEVGALPSDTTINDLTTETQQAAIDSGITSASVSTIAANTSAIANKQDILIPGNNIQINNNTISATDTEYTLPAATTSTLGGVKVGNNLSISVDGTLDSLATSYYEGSGINITNNTISVNTTIASKTDIGDGITTIQVNSTAIGTITANQTTSGGINISVPIDTTDLTNGAGYITGITSGDVTTALGYTPVNPTSLATVATSGSYTDLTNKPTIPTDTSDLTNGAGYITSSALNGYATETWVGQQGYITGISSSDITNALGYTPYDSSNPSGYTSNVGTVTSVNNISPDSNGNVDVQTSSRNIGEIVASTIPLTDSGLHLLDGSLLSGSGSYSAFVGYIIGLYNSGNYSSIFTTEYAWQTSVTNYGVCGKFVYDYVNNTVRLPKITGIVEGTTDVTALGDLVEAGLPNITGGTSSGGWLDGALVVMNGAFEIANRKAEPYGGSTNRSLTGFTFDASRSSSIYGNSSTVQPQTIKVLYYIVIATSTKTDIQVDIDEIATDLNGKADADLSNLTATGENHFTNKNLSNLTATGKGKVVTLAHELDWANAISVATTSDGNWRSYTAPSDGCFFVKVYCTNNSAINCSINSTNDSEPWKYITSGSYVTSYVQNAGTHECVMSGQTIKYAMYANANINTIQATFVPFKKS